MKKNISFQMRFLMVFTLLLLLALSFFVAQYSNTLNMEKQHVEQMKWEQFKTASSSISGLLSRCAAVVEDTPSINDCVYLDESGHVCIRDSKLQLLIEKMEERLNGIECVCTLRGSPDLYTSSGKISYSDYENVYKSEYDLNRSLFYSSLHGTTTQKVRCIYLQGTNITGAVVLMVSVSLLPASSTDMIFAFESMQTVLQTRLPPIWEFLTVPFLSIIPQISHAFSSRGIQPFPILKCCIFPAPESSILQIARCCAISTAILTSLLRSPKIRLSFMHRSTRFEINTFKPCSSCFCHC